MYFSNETFHTGFNLRIKINYVFKLLFEKKSFLYGGPGANMIDDMTYEIRLTLMTALETWFGMMSCMFC